MFSETNWNFKLNIRKMGDRRIKMSREKWRMKNMKTFIYCTYMKWFLTFWDFKIVSHCLHFSFLWRYILGSVCSEPYSSYSQLTRNTETMRISEWMLYLFLKLLGKNHYYISMRGRHKDTPKRFKEQLPY